VQFLREVQQKAAVLVAENATTLLTAGGVVGTVATGILAGRAGLKSARILQEAQAVKKADILRGGQVPSGDIPDDVLSKTEKFVAIGPQFIPQKAAALAAAYGLAERNLSDYKEKVAEKLTGPKQEAIDKEIAQDRVNNTPGYDRVVIIEGSDDSLCLDESTGRYFKSNPEKIRRAVNATNAEILRHGGASVSHFYDELELPPTSWSDTVGWGMGEQMDIKYNYIEAPDGRPVLAIDFKRMPTMHWNESYK
jgi:hypothetical protein